MPAPEHLVPILTVLGDGGTVDMAERVHRLIDDARTAGHTPPIAEAFEAGKTYIVRTDTPPDAIADSLHDLVEQTGARFAVFPTSVTIKEAHSQLFDDMDKTRSDLIAQVEDRDAEIARLRSATTASPWRLYRSDGMEPGYRLALPEVRAYVISDQPNNDYQVDDLQHEHPDLIVMPARGAAPAAGDDARDEARQTIHDLIEASSLGTPDAQAARASVPLEVGQAIAQRAAELAEDDKRPIAANDCPQPEHHVNAGAVEAGEHREIDGIHGTLILCPACRSAVVLDPDVIQPGPVFDGMTGTDEDIDWDDDTDYPPRRYAIGMDSGLERLAPHHCLTSDGVRVTCVCTTGRDHGENEMDQPSTPEVEARPEPTNAEIRAWCQQHGVPVSARGSVQKSAREAFAAARASGEA